MFEKHTVGYSNITWKEIEPIYTPLIKTVIIPPKPIPKKDVAILYNNLHIISRALGDIQIGKEAKSLYFIGAVLFHLIDKLDNAKGIDILIEESMRGDNINVDGYFEYIIQRGNRICVVEAKKGRFRARYLLGCDVADTRGSQT